MTKPTNKGFCEDLSLSHKLRREGKSSEQFEIMLSSLTLEELREGRRNGKFAPRVEHNLVIPIRDNDK